MLMQGVRGYLFNGLEATPIVLRRLIGSLDADDPQWDTVHNPDRFTLREMMAHVADWDPIFLGRIERILAEDNPFLPSVDENQLSIDRHYSTQDAQTNLDRFAEGRTRLVAQLRALPEDAWDRRGYREFVGDVSLTELIAIILGHDAYHLQQAAEYV